ncbi:MAG: DUF5688 family protein [Lachnospiraceae bacterium]|nr:DUF5688 family protein [Lachnospiraceae bacterium]
MVYETFLTTLTRKLQEQLGEDYQLTLHALQKNNGITMDGLSILAPGEAAAPTVYLNPYYQQYQHGGMKLDEIVADILTMIRSTPVPSCPTAEEMQHFDLLQSKIMFRLIHAASNQALLVDVPHIVCLDLAIVFYLFLGRSESGQMTAMIHNEHQRHWGVSEQELWKLALQNTQKEFPAEIHDMSDMMKEIAKKNLGDLYDEAFLDELLTEDEAIIPLYVLTNQIGVNGACCMLYPDTLKNFADFLNQDLVVLPSSLHEVLITPDTTETSYEELSSLVTSINQQDVPMEDQLSNQVYLYTRSDHQLHLVTKAARTVGAASLN